MNWIRVAAVATAVAVFVVARIYAARRFAATGAPWTIWILFGLPAVAGLVIGLIGLTWIDRSLLVTAFLVITGFALAYLSFRRIQATSRSAAQASTPGGRADALFEPSADYMLGLFGFLMLAGVVLLVLALTGALG